MLECVGTESFCIPRAGLAEEQVNFFFFLLQVLYLIFLVFREGLSLDFKMCA